MTGNSGNGGAHSLLIRIKVALVPGPHNRRVEAVEVDTSMSTVSSQPKSEVNDEARVRVWDPLVRLCHWALAAAFFIAYFTEDGPLTLHVWAGYTAGVLVATRIVWGFVGTRHARFTDFLYGPREVWRYLFDLLIFRAKRYLGHSPAGGAMVLALLLGVAATVWSGLELYAVEENAGPLASSSAVPISTPRVTYGFAVFADEDNKESKAKNEEHESNDGGIWEEIHESLANFVLILVIVHIAGVLLASVVHRENLTRSMLTGYKRRE